MNVKAGKKEQKEIKERKLKEASGREGLAVKITVDLVKTIFKEIRERRLDKKEALDLLIKLDQAIEETKVNDYMGKFSKNALSKINGAQNSVKEAIKVMEK